MMSGYDNFIPVWNSSKQHRTFSEPDLNEGNIIFIAVYYIMYTHIAVNETQQHIG